ncbi:MAG: hypothetical protein M1820_006407 [Bogoriella megaspora]|nr:MAG: hypothetical protein M1820_006407 [Bogoriella megaspora]
MNTNDGLLVCKTCGTQFDVPASQPLNGCRICDDPRQYVPPSGQAWTSLARARGEFSNHWVQDSVDNRGFGIGQRAFLLEASEGNVLWDCIALLDGPTVDFIHSKGGLKAICISHPHFYTTHLDWAKTFDCPVYIAAEDEEWCCRADVEGYRRLIKGTTEALTGGITAVKLGGHFPGSLVLHWENKLFIADTFIAVPSGKYHINRLPGTSSFAFMWSYPNMIPLGPQIMHQMWTRLKQFGFDTTFGAFAGNEIRSKDVKKRVLKSMKIQTRAEGYTEHALLAEADD